MDMPTDMSQAKRLITQLRARVDAYMEVTKGTFFQFRVADWMQACFGASISADRKERNHRFLEEALELVQACGGTAEESHQLVDYTFGRPVGDPGQEVGGVMVTLAALCMANELDIHYESETELKRIWTKVDQIRAKQASKPKFGPLPVRVAITALLVGQLRERTDAPMFDCKAALEQTNGNLKDAEELLLSGRRLKTPFRKVAEPNPWIDVNVECPPVGLYVLVKRNSGYTTTPFEYLTAQLNNNYKGWTKLSNDRLTDSGENPLFWRYIKD